MKIKKNDNLFFDSENGLTYKINIISINNFRPPNMKYAIDFIDPNGISDFETYGNYYFCGQDFIDKCRRK